MRRRWLLILGGMWFVPLVSIASGTQHMLLRGNQDKAILNVIGLANGSFVAKANSISDKRVLHALGAAAKRGVAVRIVTSQVASVKRGLTPAARRLIRIVRYKPRSRGNLQVDDYTFWEGSATWDAGKYGMEGTFLQVGDGKFGPPPPTPLPKLQ